MRIPLSWLRDFTPVEAGPEEVARALSFLGLVVEGTEHVVEPWQGIVVARVLQTRPHPAADRIQLVDVDTGGGEPLQICCGAFNMKAGDLVPLATLGTVMPNGLEIARRKLRGEWSNGMLCSVSELGLGEEGSEKGIFLLPSELSPGWPLSEAFGVGDDFVFDLDVGPNRADCFSVAGVARDLAAFLGLPFSFPSIGEDQGEPMAPAAHAEVADDALGLCPRFTATVFEGVGSAQVPPMVSRRLALAGMRPISPVVDVSNYVMLELGQPNHPYDLDKLAGGALLVRRARPGEVLVTLDGTSRELVVDDLVIADGDGNGVGIAGIMGAAMAEISQSTSTVLLEVANFDPQTVASTGKRLGLSSEARTRFERGVDIELAPRAINRFAELLGSRARRGPTTDIGRTAADRARITLRAERAELLLGVTLSEQRCRDLLEPLGFECEGRGDGVLDVTAPSWRLDCTREADLVEELARMYGYERIPRRLPPRPVSASSLTAYQKARRRAREVLAGAGASEAWTTSFLSGADILRAGLSPSDALELENPLDQSQSLLRPSVLPGLLRSVEFNIERQAGALALFEIGSVFRRPSPGERGEFIAEVDEREQLAVVAVGEGAQANWAVEVWQILSDALRLHGAFVGPVVEGAVAGPAASGNLSAFHAGRRALVHSGGRVVGVAGELAAEVGARYGPNSRVAALIVDLAPVLEAVPPVGAARPVSRFPATDLDVAFEVPEELAAGDLAATLESSAGELLTSMALFDVWRGPGLGEGNKSLAFRLRLRAQDRTLTEAEVAEVRERVSSAAARSHGAVLRAGK